MGNLTLNGATSGQITLAPTAVAGTNTLTLPAATGTLIYGTQPSGTIVGTTDTQTLTNKTLTSPTIGGTPVMNASVITSATTQATTSGTSVDFTSIPSWVKRIVIMFNGVSTSGTSGIAVQIGSGSVEATGYTSTALIFDNAGNSAGGNSTTNFAIYSNVATYASSGAMYLNTLGSNIWVQNHTLLADTARILSGAGVKTTSGALDRLRVTTGNGTDTFDAGSVNIMYE